MRDSESSSATTSYAFDVFINYNRSDQDAVNTIVDRLGEKDIKAWFDKTHLSPGQPWRSGVEHGLMKSCSIAAFVGPYGIGKVQREEIDVALERQSRDGTFSVIPVLLPGGCPENLSAFLRRNTWIDLRNGIDDTEEIERLFTAIRGIQPLEKTSHPSELPELLPASSGGRIRQPILSIPADDISHALSRASRDLLAWPTELPDGKWLERPELAVIHDQIKFESASTILLLGEPGSGKSALLARLAKQMVEDGSTVLGIKADFLPRDIGSHDLLAGALRLPAPPAKCIWTLAQSKRVVLFVDQLDALADLVDLHPERLNVLLDLIADASGIPNVHVIASCRMFEHNHDPRLRTLKVDPVTLDLPAWETVERLLKGRGFEVSGWPEDMREMLRVPQHFRLFQEVSKNLPEGEIFHSYHAMLDRVWELKIPEESLDLVENMAIKMGEREELWLPTVRFQQQGHVIRGLESEGILMRCRAGLQVGFRHQTLFEYARARAFVNREGTLAEYVLARQDALFVRPQLWNALHYLREADPVGYGREFEKLWNTPELRSHLRILLIEFLGELHQPDDHETAWLLPCLDQSKWRVRVLAAMKRSPGWFARLNRGKLGALMDRPPDQAAEVLPLLREASAFARDQVLLRIEQHWLGDSNRDALIWQALENLSVWDERSISMIARILECGEVDARRVGMIVGRVSASEPQLAPQLVAVFLKRRLARIRDKPVEQPEPLPEDASLDERTVHFVTHDQRVRFGKILECTDMHDLPAVAEAAPKAFLDSVWPWFLDVLGEVAYEPHSLLRIYRRDHPMATELRGDSERHHEYPIVAAIETAVTQLAVENAEVFLEFIEGNEKVEFLTAQRLLARGIEKLATTHPASVLDFLLTDPRRLMLGNGEDQHSGTIRLISSVAPYLSSQQRHQLEIGILSWSQYDHYPQSDDPKTRLDRSKWDREDRLRLWLAIPRELLTREIRQHVREEERAFPGLKERDCRSSYLRLIGSPMSVEQMAKANDEDVLNLFAELDDVTRRNHPRHWDKGGTIEASRAFEAFAKTNPDRAVSLIRAMQPSKNELTAGHGLVGLAESDYPAQSLFPLLIDLDQRGFSSDDFRHEAVRACEKLVDKQQVLAEEIVGLLETWLSPTEVCEGAEMLDPDEDATNPSHAESVLWSTGGIRTLPHGNFPILATLTKHYLTKQPADAERWLDILEAHMGQKEKMEVWKALAWPYLEPLRLAKKHRAQAFLDHLFGRFPAVRNCREGAFLIAESQRWADGSIVEKWVSDLHNSSWVRAAQASAEITTLHYAWFPSSRWASEWVSQTLDGCWAEPSNLENMRIGVAFTAANLWPIPQYRGLATTVLLQLLRDSSKLVQKAVSDLFRMTKEMPGDEHTRKLLDGLCAYPEVLSRGNANFLVKHLEGLVTSEPQRVYRVCSVILEQIGHKIADVQTSWSLRAGNLVDIALLLQRLGDNNRQNGLALFERLLELDTPNARDILIQLDRRPRHAIP